MGTEKLPKKSSRSEVDAFLRKVASSALMKPSGKGGRLIFALDATASRGPTWDHACHIQAEMFEETSGLGGLAIQLCYYRGLKDFAATGWLTNTGELQDRMAAVSCLGGHTQIGKVLRHAISETRRNTVDAMVFVGDCMEEDADKLCRLAGELGIHNVPVFLFQEGDDPAAERTFKQIARLTAGAYCPFDTGSAQQLRELLRAVAVYASGGHRALKRFSELGGDKVKLLTRQMRKD